MKQTKKNLITSWYYLFIKEIYPEINNKEKEAVIVQEAISITFKKICEMDLVKIKQVRYPKYYLKKAYYYNYIEIKKKQGKHNYSPISSQLSFKATLEAQKKEQNQRQLEQYEKVLTQKYNEICTNKQAKVIEHYLEGHTVSEIANKTNSTENAVSLLLFKGKQKLRRWFQKNKIEY